MRNLFLFEALMMPRFILRVYWLGIAVAVLAGVDPILGVSIVKGLPIIVVGLIIVRVGCESSRSG